MALKFSPELRFRVDDTFDRLDDARRLFGQEAVRRDVEGHPREEELEDEASHEASARDGPPPDWPPEGWHPDDVAPVDPPRPKRTRG